MKRVSYFLRRKKLHLLLLLMFAGMRFSAQGLIVIDDFTTAQSVGSNQSGCVTGSVGAILGDERDVVTGENLRAVFNSVVSNQLYIDNSDISETRNVALTYDGADGDPVHTAFNGLGSVDLTEGGQNNAVRISFSDVGTGGLSIGHVRVSMMDQGYNSISNEADIPVAAGEVILMFSDFDIISTESMPPSVPENFTEIGHMRIRFYLDPSTNCTVESIAIIPEPGTVLLLGVGGLFLWKRRK